MSVQKNEITVKIGDLFNFLQYYEQKKFEINQFEKIDSKIQIKDENNNWVNIIYGVKKTDNGIRIKLSNNKTIECAKKHKICYDKKNCKYAKDFLIGDSIIDSKNNINKIIEIENISDNIFYDLTIDSENHLYQTANNIIHHNTECVKTLANVLGIPLFRYDMSEFMEEHTVSKLIGSPPGYKGYEDGRAGSGLLINQVKTNPHCIILLDEIEKANPKVLNIFLQIMDNGRLTSSSGIEADFSNTFIFMTSNVGATASHKMASIGFGVKNEENGSDIIFNESFSPEFRNRLDGSVTFNNLSNEVLNTITEKFLIELKNILETKKVKLLYDTSVTKYISSKAEKENLGARPIKRIIHNEIKNVISKELVYGKLVNGGKLTISTKEKGLSFNFK